MRRFLSCILLSITLSSSYTLADTGQLNERLARYALATGDPAEALRWTSEEASPEAEAIRGLAYWELGLTPQAAEILQSVHERGETLEPEAMLVLAKAQQSLGMTGAANRLLETLQRRGSGETAKEAAFLLADQAIEASAYDQAGQVLANAPDGYWAAMGYLNLATAYARQDADTTRSLIALRVAQAMLGDRATTAYPDLLQRIQVTAGFLALKGGQPDKALGFLDKTSLNGYLTPQALYLHGVAQAQKDNYRGAMQSWHRARKFPLGFPGAADAWLGMGRGFDESGYLGQAGDAYLGAIAAFEGELVTLTTLKRQIRERGGYEAMVLAAKAEDVEWFLADSKTLTQPRLAYLMHFMERREAQIAVTRVTELARMADRLRSRRQDLQVFSRMLTERRDSLRKRVGADGMEAVEYRISALRERQQKLEAELERLTQSGRSVELASGELARKLDQVNALEAKKNLTPEEVERLKRMKGVLTWEAQQQFDLAKREHERELARVSRALDAAEDSYGRFEKQLRTAPERFAELSDRTEQLILRADQQLDRIVTLRQRAEDELDAALLDFLDNQTAVMSAHLDRSEQQIAHLYEYLALNRGDDSQAGGAQ